MTRADDLVLRRATPDDEPAILALAEQTLGWDAPTPPGATFQGLYRWKHDQNPFGPSPRWVALDGGDVVGFRVFLRWRFVDLAGRRRAVVRAVDTATHPEHQGRGIFTRLTQHALEELRAEGIDAVFNTPNDKSRPGYLKMGWVEVGRPPVGLLARPRSLPKVAKARVPADLWSLPCSAGVAATDAFAEDDLAAEALEAAGRPVGLATDRSPTHLRWRYGHGPLGYRVLHAATGPGFAVFRTRRRGPAVEATVTDVILPRGDRPGRRRLLRSVLRETGADYLLVATRSLVEPIPFVRLTGLGPLVTWRTVASEDVPALSETAFTIGDLELF